jgi:hypothetical protein
MTFAPKTFFGELTCVNFLVMQRQRRDGKCKSRQANPGAPFLPTASDIRTVVTRIATR